jgi:anti-sigma B factor antagonist
MTFTTQALADGHLVSLKGDIDYSRSSELRVELMGLLRTPVARLVIDLAGVGYMDSSGVAVLVEALQVQRKRNQKLVLCNLQPKVKGIFEIARLHTVFTITGTVTDATAG